MLYSDESVLLFVIVASVIFVAAILYSLGRRKSPDQILSDRLWSENLWNRFFAWRARRKAMSVPITVNKNVKNVVLGTPIRGDMYACVQNGIFAYPTNLLDKHGVIIGESGSGKTETMLRIAFGAAKEHNWKVFYVDAKGDRDTATRFLDVMGKAGKHNVTMFPDQPYNGWKGDGIAILNRLLSVEDFSEPYYESMATFVLSLAVDAPCGLPKNSKELLSRLDIDALTKLYQSDEDITDVLRLKENDMLGVYARYRAFFRAIAGKLDGSWGFEDVDAAYILLDGLALKRQARSLGRFLVDDFAHYVSKRKPKNQPVLLIIDEFSAIADKADAANLFERVRSFTTSVFVSSQSYAGLGEPQQAERIVLAGKTRILHTCPDPEKVINLAGTKKQMEPSMAFDEYGATGQGSAREQNAFKIDPNEVRALEQGQAVIISMGKYFKIQVAMV